MRDEMNVRVILSIKIDETLDIKIGNFLRKLPYRQEPSNGITATITSMDSQYILFRA
jgi:hypothetical protein